MGPSHGMGVGADSARLRPPGAWRRPRGARAHARHRRRSGSCGLGPPWRGRGAAARVDCAGGWNTRLELELELEPQLEHRHVVAGYALRRSIHVR